METILNILKEAPNKDVVLWLMLIENIVILVWLFRKSASLFKKKQS
jgi:hypothetical protein